MATEVIKAAGGMEIEIFVLPTKVGNFEVYCVVNYSDGHQEIHKGKTFADERSANAHADSLSEALRETQGASQQEMV